MLINVDTSGIDVKIQKKSFKEAYTSLINGDCPGAEMREWLELPEADDDELSRILETAEDIRDMADVLVVIGIGGSYLGARAAIEYIISPHYNSIRKPGPEIYFAGTSFSGDELADILQRIGDRDFCVNVISKSGTTAEPAAVFRIFRGLLEKKYGRVGAAHRIFATTDAKKGALRAEAKKNGWTTFTVPRGAGGRYSVLTPVGLLPMAVAGIDIQAVLSAARGIFETKAGREAAVTLAAARGAMSGAGKKIELFASFEPALRVLGEWWKQLFGESGGKQGKGLFPASVIYTTDLHSLGQYVQEGPRTLFETFVHVEKSRVDISVPQGSGDGLESVTGKPFDFLNGAAYAATRQAHLDGGVPCVTVKVPERSAETFGELVALFELACAVSCIEDGVNPFDQPGVEAYKKNMRELFEAK